MARWCDKAAEAQLEPRADKVESGGAVDPTQNKVEEGVCDKRPCQYSLHIIFSVI
jgi:hypothetical protein